VTDDRCTACGAHLDTEEHRPGCGNHTPIETDLHREVKFLVEHVGDIDNAVRWYQQDFNDNGPEAIADTLEADLIALAMIKEARANLAVAERDLEQVLAKSMTSKTVVVEGAGTFERSKKKDRTQWQKDELLSAVLDSRLFNPHTGELKEETPLERVLAVFNLPAPRITALRDRGIDADQFCHVEDAGYSIRHYTT
jgi:hypothetical protein